MKTCPVCGSRSFDDAGVCYGCLHRFEGSASASNEGIRDVARPSESNPLAGRTTARTIVAQFMLMVTTEVNQDGGQSWTCSVIPCSS